MKYMFENKIKKKQFCSRNIACILVLHDYGKTYTCMILAQVTILSHPQSCSAYPHFANGSCPFHRVIPCYYTECLTIDHGEVGFRRLFLLHLKPTPSSFLLAERHIKSRSLCCPIHS